MKTGPAFSVLVAAALLPLLAGCAPGALGFQSSGAASSAGGANQTPASGAVSNAAGEGVQSANPPHLPGNIAAVFPSDGSQVCQRPRISATLSIAALVRPGATLNAGDLRLSLDGEDVTSQATVQVAPTAPPSTATISYTPAADLALGAHTATVTYAPGEMAPFAWSFTVADMSCENVSPPPGPSHLGSVIGTVYPADGSTACRRPQIGADLTLTDQMRKDGAFDPTTVTLKLDGQVVEPQTVRVRQTYPASGATVLYTPDTDLALGAHEATLEYPSSGTTDFSWHFTVSDTPCE